MTTSAKCEGSGNARSVIINATFFDPPPRTVCSSSSLMAVDLVHTNLMLLPILDDEAIGYLDPRSQAFKQSVVDLAESIIAADEAEE